MDWQPIETAPKNGTTVDLWCVDGEYSWRSADCTWRYGDWEIALVADQDGDCISLVDLNENAIPTHWMPLPAPPAALGAPAMKGDAT